MALEKANRRKQNAYKMVLSWYAKFASDTGDINTADGLYKRLLEEDETHCEGLGNYAVFMYKKKKNYDLASSLFEKAVTKYPTHSTILSKYATFQKMNQVYTSF